MITSSFSGDIINASLRQMGATSIKEVRNGILYIAKFELADDLCITYVFDVTKRNRYFLQRVAPYPMSYGDFDNERSLVEFIRHDIQRFRNAYRSHNFAKFLDTANSMIQFSHAVELLFLERNVPAEDLDHLYDTIQQGLDQVRELHERAPRVEQKED